MKDIIELTDMLLDSIDKRLSETMKEFDKKVKSGDIKVRHFIIKNGKMTELPMVPTTDRISYTKKPERTKNITPTNGTKKHSGNSRFTDAEKKEILSLRKKGWAIKPIARHIKRDDKAVSAFVRSEGL